MKELTEEILSNAVEEKRVLFSSCDKILMSLEPEYAGFSMEVSQANAEYRCEEISQLQGCNNVQVCEWKVLN